LEGWYFDRYGDRVIEAELKGAFAALLVLMWLGQRAQAEAVLPAFVLGFALAPVLARHPKLRSRFRIVSFALLTPFFFLRAGLNVSLSLVLTNLGIVGLLLALKLIAKTSTVYPLARRYAGGSAWPVALLMSTGLTFGTIASQTGLVLLVINRAQFSVLVCVVVLSAIVPTALAQRILQSQSATRPHPAAQEAAQPWPYAPATEDDDEVPHQRRGQHPDQPPAYPRLPASINPPEASEARATTAQPDDQ
jgi:Kef-type K+ transport system membrane component KefB